MHTKLKGDLGEMIVAQEFMRRGWKIAFPFGENIRYDLIAEKDGKMKRVQVKAVTPKNGVLHVSCRSSNNWSVIRYDQSDFELLAAVNLATNLVYFIPSDQLRKNVIDLRLQPSKNGQSKKVNWAENFQQI